MSQKLCLSCASTDSPQTTNEKSGPTWLTRLGRKSAMPPKFQRASTTPRNMSPPNADVEIATSLDIQNVGYDVRVICWWGAMPSDGYDVVDPANAYAVAEQYPNSGFAKVDLQGKVVIKCCTPQIYLEDGQTWPRHLHFVYANGSSWDLSQVYTMAAFPAHTNHFSVTPLRFTHMFVDTQRFLQLKTQMITINALPLDYKSIPGTTYHLPSTDIVPLQILERIGDQPYIVYCEHPGCDAAVTLIKQLVKSGCHNAFYYPGGRHAYYPWLSVLGIKNP